MQKIFSALRGLVARVRSGLETLWRRFRMLALWVQGVIAVALIALVIGLVMLLGSAKPAEGVNSARTVTLRSVAELSGGATGESVIGTVRSRSEAEILAEAGGTVKNVNTSIGASVPAGYIIAELENASERASVLQAEGAYDAAVAARSAVSPQDAATTARNAYKSAFSTLETTITTYVDVFFGSATVAGPSVLLSHTLTDRDQMSRERVAITTAMNSWRAHLAAADSAEPGVLLDESEPIAKQVQGLVEEIARSANDSGSSATADQLTALASARSGVNGVLSSLASARSTWRSNSTGSTASVDASVKAALGTLRYAEANLEKTLVRAPIAGTVNFLPIRIGDYVTSLMHVATVAQNGALEVVAYVSEETRAALSVNAAVGVEGASEGGIITSIAPALDPGTHQIEVRIAVTGGNSLVNGQAVRLALPSAGTASTTASGPVMLPLAAVKLAAGSRVVFTVGTDGRLAAIPVEIGDVRGDKLEITSALPADTRIVTDARGLSAGEAVNIAAQ